MPYLVKEESFRDVNHTKQIWLEEDKQMAGKRAKKEDLEEAESKQPAVSQKDSMKSLYAARSDER